MSFLCIGSNRLSLSNDWHLIIREILDRVAALLAEIYRFISQFLWLNVILAYSRYDILNFLLESSAKLLKLVVEHPHNIEPNLLFRNTERRDMEPGRFTQPCGFGGLEVTCWPLVLKFAGSHPANAVGFLRRKKSSACLPSEGK
jgi:hypothetical protein